MRDGKRESYADITRVWRRSQMAGKELWCEIVCWWKGNIFVGSIRRGRLPFTGGLVRVGLTMKLGDLREETLLGELHQRIRDVKQGPDGLIYVLSEDTGVLLRIEPAATGAPQ